MKSCTAVFILVFGLQTAAAQIRAVLIDEKSSNPVEYAYIQIGRTPHGTLSNAEGYFELLNVSSKDTLIISHIGYTKKLLQAVQSSDDTIVIKLTSRELQLGEITIHDPYSFLLKAITKSREEFQSPFTREVFYRESVKDNAEFRKYAEALLRVQSEKKDNLSIEVVQARVLDFEKEEDDALDLVSPINVSKILEYQFLQQLDRFTGENQKQYEFELLSERDEFVVRISPIKTNETESLKWFGSVVIRNGFVENVSIEMDSLSQWKKSMLGVEATLLNFTTSMSYQIIDNHFVLSNGYVTMSMNIDHKRLGQNNTYHSSFITVSSPSSLAVKLNRKKALRTKTIYKHGNDYTEEFWKNYNTVKPTKLERELDEKLKKGLSN